MNDFDVKTKTKMGAIPEKAEEFPVSATYWLKKSNTQPWLRCLLHTTGTMTAMTCISARDW